LAPNFPKQIWFNDSLCVFYFSINDLQWMSIEFGDNLFNNFCDNKTNVVVFSSQVFINWNDLVE
jgi:hypothetical protein